MESKKLKTKVFTKEVVFTDSAEVAVDTDFIMPDYCPEISKILKCRSVARISSKSVSGRNDNGHQNRRGFGSGQP